MTYKGEDLLVMEPEERARAGIFMRQVFHPKLSSNRWYLRLCPCRGSRHAYNLSVGVQNQRGCHTEQDMSFDIFCIEVLEAQGRKLDPGQYPAVCRLAVSMQES